MQLKEEFALRAAKVGQNHRHQAFAHHLAFALESSFYQNFQTNISNFYIV